VTEKLKKARANEVAYCGGYYRICYWYNGEIQEPAKRLLDLVQGQFEVAGWVNQKGGDSKVTIKGLEILSKSVRSFNCKGDGGWSGCPVRKCCTEKGVDFCFECQDFPCANWDEKGKHSNVFTPEKKKELLEMKEIRVEEWIKKQSGNSATSRFRLHTTVA
jgi:hypothetical protein